MVWDDAGLTVAVNERCVPIPRRLAGTVRFIPGTLYNAPVGLDAVGRHFWQAVAPHGRVEVEFQDPDLAWSGNAYHDMNWGSEPLEDGFRHWTWARTATPVGTDVLYDVTRRNGSQLCFGRRFADGVVSECDVPPVHQLKKGIWGMSREVRSESPPQLLSTLEDAPFYTRNHVLLGLDGKACEAYHESLSLDRFIHPVTQVMLPFRMPRRA
jgi:carotenoid 1,2-hydratase